jgi:hypothetical protein
LTANTPESNKIAEGEEEAIGKALYYFVFFKLA